MTSPCILLLKRNRPLHNGRGQFTLFYFDTVFQLHKAKWRMAEDYQHHLSKFSE